MLKIESGLPRAFGHSRGPSVPSREHAKQSDMTSIEKYAKVRCAKTQAHDDPFCKDM